MKEALKKQESRLVKKLQTWNIPIGKQDIKVNENKVKSMSMRKIK